MTALSNPMIGSLLTTVSMMYPNASKALGLAVPALSAVTSAIATIQQIQAALSTAQSTGTDITDEQLATLYVQVDTLSAHVSAMLDARANGLDVTTLFQSTTDAGQSTQAT